MEVYGSQCGGIIAAGKGVIRSRGAGWGGVVLKTCGMRW